MKLLITNITVNAALNALRALDLSIHPAVIDQQAWGVARVAVLASEPEDMTGVIRRIADEAEEIGYWNVSDALYEVVGYPED